MLQFEREENLSVKTEESVVVVEDVGSSQGESVTQVAGPGEKEFSRNPLYVPVEKLQRSEEKSRLENPESVRIETACVAAVLGVQSSVVCIVFIKTGGKRPMPGERAAITIDEADEYVDVVGSSTPVLGGVDSERFTFKESVNHDFLQDSGGFFYFSGLPLFMFF